MNGPVWVLGTKLRSSEELYEFFIEDSPLQTLPVKCIISLINHKNLRVHRKEILIHSLCQEMDLLTSRSEDPKCQELNVLSTFILKKKIMFWVLYCVPVLGVGGLAWNKPEVCIHGKENLSVKS